MIAISGAGGYLGQVLLRELAAGGATVLALTRRPERMTGAARHYALGEAIAPGSFDGVETVIHAAFDFTVGPAAYLAINTMGSVPLLDAAQEAGARVILISSLSAFDKSQSAYGQSKRALERLVLERGGLVVRPGLVFGASRGGLFGRIVETIERHRVVPLPGLHSAQLFMTHDLALSALCALLARHGGPEVPIFAAHEAPTSLARVTAQVSATLGRSTIAIPIPWRIPYVGLRALEAAHVQLPFASDSLLGLMRAAPAGELERLARTAVTFPPLDRLRFARDTTGRGTPPDPDGPVR